MSKTTKNTTKAAAKVTTPVTEIATKSATKAPTKSATKAPTKSATKAPTKSATKVETPVVVQPVIEPVVAETAIDPIAVVLNESTEFIAKLTQLGSYIAKLKSEYRMLEKQMIRELKLAQKNGAKRKRKVGNRAPSGFVKPTLISDELATFLEKPTGTEMARTDVTREINKYIRAHDLQDKSNGRKINPDNKLSSLLKLQSTDELTYFNLQKYMSIHFQKSAATLAAAAAAAATIA